MTAIYVVLLDEPRERIVLLVERRTAASRVRAALSAIVAQVQKIFPGDMTANPYLGSG